MKEVFTAARALMERTDFWRSDFKIAGIVKPAEYYDLLDAVNKVDGRRICTKCNKPLPIGKLLPCIDIGTARPCSISGWWTFDDPVGCPVFDEIMKK